MKKGRLYERQEIEVIAKSAIGKSVNDILKEDLITVTDDNASNKGGLGLLIEKYLYGIDANSDSEPDFMPAGIELKVTPYKKLKSGKLSAKERLVLNTINYIESSKEKSFYESHFWFKNNTIQLIWYLWKKGKDKKDLKITHEMLLELIHSEDLNQIEQDWKYINKKIKNGKAHELSEADTMFLGACTKGTNSKQKRPQPNGPDAMPRAFCFKTSYMTQLVRKYIGSYDDVEKILEGTNLLFMDYIDNVLKDYVGMSQEELLKMFNIKKNQKDKNSVIINKIFNVKKGLKNTAEFLKANIIPKAILINKNGKIKESISFPSFKFKNIIEQNWEDSDLKEELETTKYLFFIFEEEKNNTFFKGYKLWNMPQTIIDSVIKECWEKTVNKIKCGVNFKIKNTSNGPIVENDLPGLSDNGIIHVRPHTSKSAYKLKNGFSKGNIKKHADELPDGQFMTKQSFWFNNTYIKKVLFDEVGD